MVGTVGKPGPNRVLKMASVAETTA